MTGTLVNPPSVVPDPLRVEPPLLVVERSTTRPPARRRRTAIIPLVVVVIGAWLIASFWSSVDTRSPRQPFLAPTAGQTWIRSPEPGPHAFFRLNLPIGALPQSATLWFSADQAAEPYVNGEELADTPRTQTANGTYVPRLVETLDIRPGLVVGDNVIGLEVINYDNRPPAFQARIRIESGGLVQTFGVSPSSWLSTSNVALTGQILPRSGAFATTALEPVDWVSASAAGPRIGATTVPVAPDSYTTPASADAIVGSTNGHQLTVSSTVDFPSGCTNSWLRVAANGPYTVAFDGRTIASGAGTWRAIGVARVNTWSIEPLENTIPLTVYDLCPVERSGSHRLTVSVTSPTTPIVYVDGVARSGSAEVRYATGPRWTASGSAQPNLVADPEALLNTKFQTTTAPTTVPAGPQFLFTMTLVLLFLGLACAVVLASNVHRHPSSEVDECHRGRATSGHRTGAGAHRISTLHQCTATVPEHAPHAAHRPHPRSRRRRTVTRPDPDFVAPLIGTTRPARPPKELTSHPPRSAPRPAQPDRPSVHGSVNTATASE